MRDSTSSRAASFIRSSRENMPANPAIAERTSSALRCQ
jgi:hypothetical protein